MLDFSSILQSYPPTLRSRGEHIYKEYLQYHILEGIFQWPHAQKLCFIWWTALRLCFDNNRFSEDLDFDNKHLSFDEFEESMEYTRNFLELKWFKVETRVVRKWAYHYFIKFPELLYDVWLSPMKSSKILIQIDTHDQWIAYEYNIQKITKFETLSMVNIAPVWVLLAQKLFTVFERKRMKWRDFFDIMFLRKQTTEPHRWYIEKTIGISTPQALKEWLVEKSKNLDFKKLQDDVQAFLFQPENTSVLRFREFIEHMEFERK